MSDITPTASPVTLSPAAQQWATAILTFVVTVVTALAAAVVGHITATVIVGLVVVILQSVISTFVPLVAGFWAGALKVGIPVILAVLYALVPLLTGTAWTIGNTLILILAGVNALAAQLGIAIRKTAPIDAGVAKIGQAAVITSAQPPRSI